MDFIHLTTHSHYSLLEAMGSPKALVNKAKELDFEAMALTDKNYMYGAVEFYKAAKEAGIKPIIGTDFSFTPGSRYDNANSQEISRLTLIAKNNNGYGNLLKLSSKSIMESNQPEPLLDFELLEKHKSDLICLTGNIEGIISTYLLNNDLANAKKTLQKLKKLFNEDLFIQIERNSLISGYKQIEQSLLDLSKELNIELVASDTSRYINHEDYIPHDILVCIGKQTNLLNENRRKYHGDHSLKTKDFIINLFKDLPEAVANTKKIADKCELKLKFDQSLIPKFKTPDQQTSKDYLKELCLNGLYELYPKDQQEKALKQLDYELDIVDKMGFNDYFLIVWDFIYFAKSNGIVVGPGRGSAAGSIIAYTLKITELDPIEHGLVFERFLNPDRISMPDIDIDFADHRRHEVFEYTIKKYGNDCVSQVITYGTMSAKAAVRDVGRGMGYPYSEVDKIAKAIPQPKLGKHKPLNISVKADPELSVIYNRDPRAKALLDNAIKLEGTVRHAGTHACAVIISDIPLIEFTPLQKATDGGEGIVTQYSMKVLEDIGLLKMDFLGLKNLTIIEKAINIIKTTKEQEINISTIPLDDESTFKLLQNGDTTGVFQLESSGMRRYIRELKPTAFEDIVAMISLYRPGPMEWIPAYIEGKHNPSTVKYLDSSFEEILKETNGIAIYQEQILLIARHFAGFSLGQADILRRAVGKKIPEALAEQKDKFIQGAIQCGHEEEHARNIFVKVIEPFAGYGFNKAHAACYAMISYRTCYLKAHYPTELMTALLTSDSDNTDKIALEMADCESMGIRVLPPSINTSLSEFSVEKDKQIRFGLSAIKGLGDGAIKHLIEERSKNGNFKSLTEFVSRLPSKAINKKTIECLAYAGALDEFGERNQLAGNYETITQYAREIEKSKNINEDQTDMFAQIETKNMNLSDKELVLGKRPPLTIMEKLKKEREYLGVFVSSRPLKGLKGYLSKKVKLISDLTEKNIGKNVKIGGLLTNIRTIITKSGSAMAYAEIEDPTYRISIVIFPKIFKDLKFLIKEDNVYFVDGKLEYRRGEPQLSVYEMKGVSIETMINNAKTSGIYNPDEIAIRTAPVFNVSEEKKTDNDIENSKKENKKTDDATNKYKFIVKKDQKVFILLPTNLDEDNLNKLKTFLISNKGDKEASIVVEKNGQKQTITTGLKINDNDETLNTIEKILS